MDEYSRIISFKCFPCTFPLCPLFKNIYILLEEYSYESKVFNLKILMEEYSRIK